MPSLPAGEASLRALARRFEDAERRVRALLARAPEGDRRELLAEALAVLVALRREDFQGPVYAAYLAAFGAVRRGGREANARGLAGSLAKKLDRGVQVTATNSRQAFRAVTVDNLEEMIAASVVAHADARDTRWPLGAWAVMNTETIGRQASSRGLSDSVGPGGKVTIDVGECGFCQEFAGEATVGEDPLPPFHPSCTCVASAG